MAVAIPQVITEDRASGAQVIDGSLRFDDNNKQHLTQTIGNGTNGFTISCWMKPCQTGNRDEIFDTTASTGFYLYRHTDGSIRINNNSQALFTSNGLYRDTSAFYNIVFSYDSTSGYGTLWVNGRCDKSTAFSTQLYAGTAKISSEASNDPANYYLGQWYLIDGLALGPDYFGYTDPLTNTWRPKKFRAEGTTINDGTQWSSFGSGSLANGNWGQAFDGTRYMYGGSGPSNGPAAENGTITFAPTKLKGRYVRMGVRGGSNKDFTVNDKSMTFGSSNAEEAFIDLGTTQPITSIKAISTSGGVWAQIYWIEVDGVLMKDNTTQNLAFGTNGFYLPMDGNSPIGEDKSGQGNNWTPVNFGSSNSIEKATGAKPILNTSNGGNLPGIGVFGSRENRFYETTSASNSGGKYVFEGQGTQPTFSFIRGATYTFDWSASSGHPLRFATAADAAGSTEYTDGTNVSGNVTKITVPHNAPDTLYYYCNVHNGMGNSISVTTDESKADPYAWKCVYAMPLIDKNDTSNQVNCTSTTKGTTDTGSTADGLSSAFYGQSRNFDSSNDTIYTTANSADFQFGSGDFTIEAWVLNEGGTNDSIVSCWNYPANRRSWNLYMDGAKRVSLITSVDGTNQENRPSYADAAKIVDNKWTHVAVTKASNVYRVFVDGDLKNSLTQSETLYSNANDGVHIGSTYGATEWWNGGIQDVRVYKGVAKYTSNFIPASTNPVILPDSPSGVATKSKLKKVTDGAVDFTGSNQYLKTNASSTDFTFGTGDFTVEMMLYNRENAGKGFIQISDTAGGLKATSSGVITIHKDGSSHVFRAYVKNGSTAFSTTVPYKRWCHVALVRESGTIKLFVDGKQDATTVTGDTTNYATTYVAIGGYYDTSYLSNCTISNVRINKGTAVYTKDFTPPTAPLTNITNTKLLCCQSNTSTLDAAVTPSGVSIAANWMPAGYTYWDAGYRAGWFKNAPQKITTQTLSDYIPSAMPTSGKHYWEIKVTSVGTYHVFGVTDDGGNAPGADGYQDNMSGIYYNGSTPVFLAKKASGTSTADRITHGESTGTTFSSGDVVMFALDADSNKMWIGKNGVWYDSGDPSTGTNASFQNMPTSGAYFKTAYSTTGSGTMKFQIMSASVGPKVSASNPFTDDINAVRGQESTYATLDPIYKGAQVTLTEGNLKVSVAGGSGRIFYSTLGATSGKWYAEYTAISATSTNMIGISRGKNPTASYLGADTNHGYGYYGNGQRYVGGTGTPWNDGFTTGDTIGIALDLDNREVSMYKNGNYLGVLADSLPRKTTQYEDTYFFAGGEGSMVGTMNFGQKPFKFPPPDGFQPLTTTALRQITPIPRPDKFVGTTLYTGSGDSVSPRAIELPHSADLVWVKSRDRTSNHQLADTVRGNNSILATNNTQSARNPTTQYTGGGISSINGKTVTLASGTSDNRNLNTVNEKGVVWSWKAGGSSNTFNVDDVGYASASSVNMSVGALDAVAYNKDQNWSAGLTASSGLADAAYAFNGNLSNRAQSAQGTNAKLFFAPPSPLSFTERVEIYCDQGDNTPKAYWNGNIISPGGGKWITIAVGSGTIDATNPIIIDTRGANQFATLKAVRVDGRLLINNGASTSSVPSIANTGSSVGTKQGFSIVKYQGNGGAATIAHGLTQRPDLIIHKFITGSSNWSIWHPDLSASERFIFTSDGPQSSSSFQNVNKYTFDVASGHNDNSVDMIAYCWHDVPGLQKFGTYLGNNSTNGPFVELGFKPAIIIFKNLDASANWMIYDSKRDARNEGYRNLFPNLNNVDNSTATDNEIDFLSNGFKLRNDDGQSNDANSYVYMAWAESPVANMFGAQSNAR